MAASGSSASIEVTLCRPPGPTKHPHQAPNPPGNTRGCATDPTLDTHNGHTEKQGEDRGWVCSAGMEKGQELLLCFWSLCHRRGVATRPRVSAARYPTSLTAAGFVAGALSQAQKDIARPRR